MIICEPPQIHAEGLRNKMSKDHDRHREDRGPYRNHQTRFTMVPIIVGMNGGAVCAVLSAEPQMHIRSSLQIRQKIAVDAMPGGLWHTTETPESRDVAVDQRSLFITQPESRR
jgi:hypothetical protein